MSEDSTVRTNKTGPNFESIRHVDETGAEYWLARELMPLLEYEKWQKFEEAIKRARIACVKSGNNEPDHFTDAGKMIETGKGAHREIRDYRLSKYACYLCAQNSDSRKEAVALAQTYFAVQAQRMETIQKLLEEENNRLQLRQDLEEGNKALRDAAIKSGVTSPTFGIFFDAGYYGFYKMSLARLQQYKGVPPGQNIIDFMRSMELAWRVMHNGLTEAVLSSGKAKTAAEAAEIHRQVGEDLRAPLVKHGFPPEDYPLAEKSIRPLLNEKKKKEKKARAPKEQGKLL